MQCYVNKDGERISPGSCFLYELTTYLVFKNRFEQYDAKYLKSNREMRYTVSTQTKPFFKIIKYFSMVEAPLEYIQLNNLAEWKLQTPICKKKKKK